ncbi:hypothetical protein BH10CYA1_BH10CYA1_54970 [soil metagenome]
MGLSKSLKWRLAITAGFVYLVFSAATASSAKTPGRENELVNLAIMKQTSGDHRSALAIFARARDVNPSDWRAWLGQAQSLMLVGRKIESIAVLQDMVLQESSDFNWQYQLGQALLYFDRPDLAVIAATKAAQLANDREQKSSSLNQLFLCYVRCNDKKRAEDLMHQVFSENQPIDAQIYIRAAQILPVLRPDTASQILNAALLKLDQPGQSGTFFSMGQIFDDKARFVSYDRTKNSAWLDCAAIAYRQALKLDPKSPIYSLALAKAAAQRGDFEELTQQLSRAHAAGVQDQIPGYLLSKIMPVQIAATDSNASLLSSVVNRLNRVQLTQAQVSINGLNCACKRTIIINSFKQIRGLVLTTISPKFPFVATILIDESMISLPDVLDKIAYRPLPEFSYTLISSKPIKSVEETLKIDLDGHDLSFHPVDTYWTQLELALPNKN